MAEEVTEKKVEKGKGLKGKWHGIPKPVLLIGAGIGAFILYRWYQNRSSSASTTAATGTSSTTPTSTTDTGTSGYPYGGGGGIFGGGGGTGTGTGTGTTTDTGTTTATGGTTGVPSGTAPGTTPTALTPAGRKTNTGAMPVIANGVHFTSTAGSFSLNGSQYFGVPNPTVAKKLEAAGVTLVHNPTNPKGNGLFAIIPKGKSTVLTHPLKTQAGKTATGTKSGTGADYTGAGVTQAPEQANKNRAPAKTPKPAVGKSTLPKGAIAVHTGGRP